MEYAKVIDPDGGWYRNRWVFAEVGIADVLEKLQLGDDNDRQQSTRAKHDHKKAPKRGQIEVKFHRIKLGKTSYHELENSNKDLNDEEASASDLKDVSHTIVHKKGKTKMDRMMEFIGWSCIDDPEKEPYAVFRFYYKSEEMIQKLKLRCDTPKARDDEVQGISQNIWQLPTRDKRKADEEVEENTDGSEVVEANKKVKEDRDGREVAEVSEKVRDMELE